MSGTRWWKCVLPAAAIACSGGGRDAEIEGDTGAEEHLRPADAPDVVVLAVSGHCLPGNNCDGYWNPEYLAEYGTLGAVEDALENEGLSVESAAFVDDLYTWVDDDDNVLARGFLDLLGSLDWVYTNWIEGFDNPTRIVIVAHSHGDVWAHIAVSVADYVPIDLLIDLDGVSHAWESDGGWYFGVGDQWRDVIIEFTDDNEITWPFEIWEAEDAWRVGDEEGLDIEDITPPNVRVNLEVWSSPDSYECYWFDICDHDRNIRYDGGHDDIYYCKANEDHGDVYRPKKYCMNWVVDTIDNLY